MEWKTVKRKDWKGTNPASCTNLHLQHSHQVVARYLIQMWTPSKWQLMDKLPNRVSVLWIAPTYTPQQKHLISETSKLSGLTSLISHRTWLSVQNVSNTLVLHFSATKLSSIVCPHCCLTKSSHLHRQIPSAPRGWVTGCSRWKISTPVLITFLQFQTQ